MYYQERDHGINFIKARPGRYLSGGGIGIILLDDFYPAYPGDIRNPSAYPFPIQYEVAVGVDVKALVYDEDKAPCLEPIVQAAKKLEEMGCRAIAAECGYFAYFQKEVAKNVNVPVFLSSLLQVPFAQQVIGEDKAVGIFCFEQDNLTKEHLKRVGIDTENSRYYIKGSQHSGCDEFAHLWNWEKRKDLPESYYDKSEKEIVNAVKNYIKEKPDIGAIMLECTGMQHFGRAIQREVDLPVFDWSTLLDYAYFIVAHRDFYGHV
ncbi:hypothetical protein EUCA11A_33640 [Eubacterium callanderi]|uniref:aspartate/glutamate racemase family protein n=1 Tax=Eubacterium callanderi TaxID=53442 RepID=UPI0029FF4B44|nr:aspartate/glutamate racemase family protein [Eubacterium callanderi]WPK69176.1 hypothetical protein EUCA2A_33640 [Eubacterium callanderi]WPK73474.1 hypothetical protein EUCA11A_33640 [Eubacterium callanderi]